MKIILVDAVDCFVDGEGNVDREMHAVLEEFSNEKIILTNADDEQMKKFGLDNVPYEVFTLKHNPDKTDPVYFQMFLEQHELKAEDVVYFEHSKDAVASAKSLGITTYHFDHEARDLGVLKNFLEGSV